MSVPSERECAAHTNSEILGKALALKNRNKKQAMPSDDAAVLDSKCKATVNV